MMADTRLGRDARIAARSARDLERVRLARLDPSALHHALDAAEHRLYAYGQLHDSRRVDLLGAPELRAVIIHWLDGDPSERSKLKLALHALNREHPKLYRVVNAILSPVEIGENRPTERVLAVQLAMSKTTVHRSILAIRTWLRAAGIE